MTLSKRLWKTRRRRQTPGAFKDCGIDQNTGPNQTLHFAVLMCADEVFADHKITIIPSALECGQSKPRARKKLYGRDCRPRIENGDKAITTGFMVHVYNSIHVPLLNAAGRDL
jgi:hypothetical protein